MDRFDFVSPLDFRYFSSEFSAFLSENGRIKFQARVEAALVRALSRQGVCSKKIALEIEKACEKVRAFEVYEEEEKTRHDVRALVNVIKRKVSDKAKPFVHFGATSYDIVDTANALRYKAAAEKIVLPALIDLEKELIKLALKNAFVVQIGRTHGQHAEPITFGFALAEYVDRLGNRIKEIERAKDNLCGKFSGAVGAFNSTSIIVNDPQRLERDILLDLGLKVPLHSTQVVHPESVQDLVHALLGAFTVLANFSDDMRNLQRSEISEVAEAVLGSQVGSSTMPHKRNPITFENVKSMWKQFMPRMVTVYMDSISEHQRDLTNSASQRFLPELFVALAVSAQKLCSVSKKLVVDKTAMSANFSTASQLVVAEPLYILLAKHGHADAHEAVRLVSQKAREQNISVLEAAKNDAVLKKYFELFSESEKKILENPQKYIGLSEEKTKMVCIYWKKVFK